MAHKINAKDTCAFCVIFILTILIDCKKYKQSVTICEQLLEELLKFENDEEIER
jgi:hypothetical protein